MIYYTFREIQRNPFRRIEVAKWDENDSMPLETYEVLPEGRKGRFMCSCPAYVVCKHSKAVLEAMKDGKINELYNWRWSVAGWQRCGDMQWAA